MKGIFKDAFSAKWDGEVEFVGSTTSGPFGKGTRDKRERAIECPLWPLTRPHAAPRHVKRYHTHWSAHSTTDLPEGVTYTPREGSCQLPEHRAPSRELAGVTCRLDPCIRSHKSAGLSGSVRRDRSDGWRSPVPRGDNTGGPDGVPPPPTIACWGSPTGSEVRD